MLWHLPNSNRIISSQTQKTSWNIEVEQKQNKTKTFQVNSSKNFKKEQDIFHIYNMGLYKLASIIF